MKKIINNKTLVLIVFLAAILRLYRLGEYPALNADEAAIGYNAYSLANTGLDEHGNAWPVHFQSFNDYKPGGLFYIVLPFVKLFGLNEWSVRFPAAVFGVLSIVAIYFLVKEFTRGNKKYTLTPLVASFILAISPWHIHFSRGAWEVNVATFFILVGIYLFIKGTKNPHLFALSMLAFVASLYTYHAARLLVPVLGLGLLFFYRKILFGKNNIRLFFGSLLFSVIILIPLVSGLLGQAGSARASGVSILADRGYIDRINVNRGRMENPNSLMAKILYNKPKEIVLEFSQNYFEHFWGEFLFLSGDEIQRNKVPDFGELYYWQFPFLIIGVFVAMKNREKWQTVLFWLLIAPIPAALTFQSPHALRAQSMVIPLSIITAIGLSVVWGMLRERSRFACSVGVTVLMVVVAWDASRYLHNYWVHMAKAYPYSSQYGVKELVKYLDRKYSNEREILVTTRYDQPYILFLFYSQYPPKSFQAKHVLTGRDEFGFSTVPSYDRYVFKKIDYDTDRKMHSGALIVGTDEEIIEGANVLDNIVGQNGFLYFQIVK